MKSNKSVGNAFEQTMCEILGDYGFWAHNMTQSRHGQPADIIAVRHGDAHLIDCKDCASGVFDMRRIEPNQLTAMNLWYESGNGDGWFAVRFGVNVYMVTLEQIDNAEKRTLREGWFADHGKRLHDWMVTRA